MKRLLAFFALGVTVVIAIAATVKISDLPLSTSPSTNTYIEIADMSAVTKSAKFQFNGVTKQAITNALAAPNDTNQVLLGNGGWGTVAGGSSLWNTNYAPGVVSTDSTNVIFFGHPGVSEYFTYPLANAPLQLFYTNKNVRPLWVQREFVDDGDGGPTAGFFSTVSHLDTAATLSSLQLLGGDLDHTGTNVFTLLEGFNFGIFSDGGSVSPAGVLRGFTMVVQNFGGAAKDVIGYSSQAYNSGTGVAERSINFMANGTGGATNNYDFYSSLNSGSGNWAFYGAGTADSHFGGTVSTATTNQWKVTAIKSCSGLTMVVTNYIEFVYNGVTNAIPLGTITP